MTDKYKMITVTKMVPVADVSSLMVWLNKELEDWVRDKRDMGAAKATVGTKAVELILEAGFTFNPPRVNR